MNRMQQIKELYKKFIRYAFVYKEKEAAKTNNKMNCPRCKKEGGLNFKPEDVYSKFSNDGRYSLCECGLFYSETIRKDKPILYSYELNVSNQGRRIVFDWVDNNPCKISFCVNGWILKTIYLESIPLDVNTDRFEKMLALV